MMFGASPPTVTMPCTRSRRQERLAQQPDGDLGDDQRVGGIDAALGKRAGVRRHARVRDVERLGGEDLGSSSWSLGPGWTISAAWTPSNDARVEQELLAAAALLGRCAQHRHAQPKLVCHAAPGRPPRQRTRPR